MEVKKQSEVSYRSSDLKQEVIKGLVKLTTFAKENNYRLTTDGMITDEKEVKIDAFDLVTKFSKNLEAAFDKSSKSTKKEVYKRLRGINRVITLKKVNTFLSFLRTKVLKEDNLTPTRFVLSEREQRICATRTNWIVMRDAAEVALRVYKETKGDFYKVEKV